MSSDSPDDAHRTERAPSASDRPAPELPGELAQPDAQSDALFGALITASDDAVIARTLDGTIRVWNPAAERLLGWTAAEAIGQPITIVIPFDRRGEEADATARISAGEHIRHYETVRQRKDGRYVDVSLSIAPVRDATGRVTMAVKFIRDITEEHIQALERQLLLEAERAARAEAERMQLLLEEQALELEAQAAELEVTIDEQRTTNQELEQEREKAELARIAAERATHTLQAVLTHLPVGVFVAEAPTGRIILHNRVGDELLGERPARRDSARSVHDTYSAERLDGTPYEAKDRPLTRALLDHEIVTQEELRYCRQDGTAVDLSVSAAPIRDAAGNVIMAVSTFIDVTERRAAQRAVAESEALFRGVFSAPGIMMLVLEQQRVVGETDDYLVVVANGEMSEWVGMSPDTVVGSHASSFASSAEGAERMAALFDRVLASGSPVSVELPSAARLGAWLRMSVSPIATAAGRPPRLGILMVDITDEHRREDQRRRMQHLVEHATDFIGVSNLDLTLDYVNPAGLALVGAPSLDAVLGRSSLEMFDLASKLRLESEILPTLRRVGRWSGESLMRQIVTGESIPVELTVFALADPFTQLPVGPLPRVDRARARV